MKWIAGCQSGLARLRDGWPPKPAGVLFNLHEKGIMRPPVYYAGKDPYEGIRIWFVMTPIPLGQLPNGFSDLRIAEMPGRTSMSIVNCEHFEGKRRHEIIDTIIDRTPPHKLKDGVWTCTACGVKSPDPCNCNCHTARRTRPR